MDTKAELKIPNIIDPLDPVKGFDLRVTDEQHVNIFPRGMTVDEFIVLAGASLELALKSAYNQMEAKVETEEDKTALRAALYDRLILITTEIAQSIYPEYVDLYEKTPEAFLEELDKKVKILNDATKDNK